MEYRSPPPYQKSQAAGKRRGWIGHPWKGLSYYPGWIMALPVIIPRGIEDIDDAASCNPSPGVARSRRNYCYGVWSQDPRFTAHGQLELAGNDTGNLFMGMGVFGKNGIGLYIPVGTRHMLGMNKAALETRSELLFLEILEIEKRHRYSPPFSLRPDKLYLLNTVIMESKNLIPHG